MSSPIFVDDFMFAWRRRTKYKADTTWNCLSYECGTRSLLSLVKSARTPYSGCLVPVLSDIIAYKQ